MWSPCTCTERTRAELRLLLAALLAMLACPASAQSIEKLIMPGEVIAGHAKYETDCRQCHAPFDKAEQPKLCLDCHKDVARDVATKTRLHGRLDSPDCRACHTEHKGRQARIAVVDAKSLDHAKTEFKLNGKHADIGAKCESCHRPKTKYRDAPRLCNDCHRKDDQEKGHQGKLGAKCETCHNERTWKETHFDHEKTKFPLRGGKHAEVKCEECHVDKTYRDAPLTCIGCHKDDDQEKGHRGRYGTKCETCHNDRAWKEVVFNHDTKTRYLLKGKHRQTKCDSCHLPEKGALYGQKLAVTCVSCHRDDDRKDGHQGKLGDKCQSCHDERAWKGSSNFDHERTKFALLDKHKDAKCEACHKGGVAGAKASLKVDKECVACHRKDDDAKGHRGRYGTKCADCHDAKGWKSIGFDHDKSTKYALKSKHRQTKCDACHLPEKGDIYRTKLDTACIACHAKDDTHKGQLGKKCAACHDEKRWQGAPYDHDKSRYPLTGSHAKVTCKKCHLTPAFRDASSACNACHEKDDKHRGSFGAKCETCHTTGTWKAWDFDHGTTKFKLVGGHVKIGCAGCHKAAANASAAKPGRACFACHLKDDVHDGGFSLQCERCHDAINWRRIRQ
jgi:hypothetical protein